MMVSKVLPKNITIKDYRSDLMLKLEIPVEFLLDDAIIDGIFKVGTLCRPALNQFDATVFCMYAQLGVRFVYVCPLSEWIVEPICFCKEKPTPSNIYMAWIELVKQLRVLVDRLLDDHVIRLML